MAFLLCMKTGKTYSLDETFFTIGSYSKSNLVSSPLSHKQFELHKDNEGVWRLVACCGSSGSKLNNEVINNGIMHVLNDGDRIQVDEVASEITAALEWKFKRVPLTEECLKAEIERLENVFKTEMALFQEKLQQISLCNTELGVNESFSEIATNFEKVTELIIDKDLIKKAYTELTHAAAEQGSISKGSVEKLMESELECCVCNELFITAVTLNCSHTFCRYCLLLWKKKTCPTCRSEIVAKSRSLVLDNFIEKMVQSLSPDFQQLRESAVKERERVEAEMDAFPVENKCKESEVELSPDF